MNCRRTILLLLLMFLAGGCGSDAPELAYSIEATDDISNAEKKRKVSRVSVDVSEIASEDQLKSVAIAVWKAIGRGQDEFTVFLYLPEMDYHSLAYAVGVFSRDGIQSFKINEWSLFGHPWYSQTQEAREQEAKKAAFAQLREGVTKHEYHVTIEAESVVNNLLTVRIATDFPMGTVMNVGVGREHWLRGSKDVYSGELYQSYSPVKDGTIAFTAKIDDSPWINQHEKLVAAGIGIEPIARISDEIEISVLYTPFGDQPQSVAAILGKEGERVSGEGAENSGRFITYRAEKTLSVPVNR